MFQLTSVKNFQNFHETVWAETQIKKGTGPKYLQKWTHKLFYFRLHLYPTLKKILLVQKSVMMMGWY